MKPHQGSRHSAAFLSDAVAPLTSNTMISYIYQMRKVVPEISANGTQFGGRFRHLPLGYAETLQVPEGWDEFATIQPDATQPVADLVECDATPESLFVFNQLEYSSINFSLSTAQIKDPLTYRNNFQSAEIVIDTIGGDILYEAYLWEAFSYYSFGWMANAYYDDVFKTVDLLMSAYAPMVIRRTYANGTAVDFLQPMLQGDGVESETSTTNPTQVIFSDGRRAPLSAPPPIFEGDTFTDEVVSLLALDVSMTAFMTLMSTVTPKADGAHTSLYDLAQHTLVCTSVPIPLFDASREGLPMWTAGQAPHSGLSEAFYRSGVAHRRAGTIVSTADPSDTTRRVTLDDGDVPKTRREQSPIATTTDGRNAAVTVESANKFVVSSVRIQTTSGIDFVIVHRRRRSKRLYERRVDPPKHHDQRRRCRGRHCCFRLLDHWHLDSAAASSHCPLRAHRFVFSQ